jgi:tetratricopeptide (TPR) repeat protein
MAHLDDAEAAVPVAEESLALFEEIGDLWGQATALDTMAYAYRASGRYLDAIGTYERCLELRTRFDAPVLRATTLLLVGELHLLREDFPRARRAYEEVSSTWPPARVPGWSPRPSGSSRGWWRSLEPCPRRHLIRAHSAVPCLTSLCRQWQVRHPAPTGTRG